MLLGIVEGVATSHIKHQSMEGWKMLIVQPLDVDGQPSGDPLVVIDKLGAGHGQKVLISSDGKGTREMVGDTTSPLRWSVVGLHDE